MSRRLLVATRNPHKLDEICDLLGDRSVEVLSLDDIGLERHPAEDSVETHDTFEDNALAKARYYRGLTGLPTIADDSGLCVDALHGGPGVRSRRFAPAEYRGEMEEDVANNAWLLEQLSEVPSDRRGAHYRCALALIDDDRSLVVNGRVDGRIAEAERGRNGFGYDPLFIPDGSDETFGELPPEVKAVQSHRADAIRGLRPWID